MSDKNIPEVPLHVSAEDHARTWDSLGEGLDILELNMLPQGWSAKVTCILVPMCFWRFAKHAATSGRKEKKWSKANPSGEGIRGPIA